MKNCLEEAMRLTDGDRQQAYGEPHVIHERIAHIWSSILGHHITPAQAALCMAGLKLARLSLNPEHEDSMTDLAGYARIYQRILEHQNNELER